MYDRLDRLYNIMSCQRPKTRSFTWRRVQQAMPKRRYTSIGAWHGRISIHEPSLNHHMIILLITCLILNIIIWFRCLTEDHHVWSLPPLLASGPIHSVQHQAGTDFRLHNRWLQLSMQCDTNAAMAEFRRHIWIFHELINTNIKRTGDFSKPSCWARSAARNNSKPKPSLKKVSRSEMWLGKQCLVPDRSRGSFPLWSFHFPSQSGKSLATCFWQSSPLKWLIVSFYLF